MNDAEAEAFRAGMAAVTRDVQKALTEEYERNAVRSNDGTAARLAVAAVAISLKARGVPVTLPSEELLWLKPVTRRFSGSSLWCAFPFSAGDGQRPS